MAVRCCLANRPASCRRGDIERLVGLERPLSASDGVFCSCSCSWQACCRARFQGRVSTQRPVQILGASSICTTLRPLSESVLYLCDARALGASSICTTPHSNRESRGCYRELVTSPCWWGNACHQGRYSEGSLTLEAAPNRRRAAEGCELSPLRTLALVTQYRNAAAAAREPSLKSPMSRDRAIRCAFRVARTAPSIAVVRAAGRPAQ